MRKHTTAILLAFIFIIQAFVQGHAMTLEYDGGRHEYNGSIYDLYVNGSKIQTPLEPIIFNDRAVVPVREVFEALGATVGYEHDTRQVTIETNDASIILTINQNTALVNGSRVSIPDGVAPKLIAKAGESAKTMVPVRFVSESIGMDVSFDNDLKRISVNSPRKDITLTNLTSSKVGTSSVKITVTADKAIESMSNPVLTSNNVYYTDIANATYKINNSYEINYGGVKAVRIGEHDTYTRIAVDLDRATSYDMQLSSDGKSVVITVSGAASTAVPTANPTASPTVRPSAAPTANPGNAGKKIVVLDAGHGGSDPGASGSLDGSVHQEKDITLSITKKVQSILQNNGITVVMTRSGDLYPTLTERAELANQQNAALFVSIHINSVENAPSASGAEIYYSASNNGDDYGATSKELASNILSEVIKQTNQRNRGVKTAEHVVTRSCNMPAALLEVGFITNEEELRNMLSDSWQTKVATGVANGIIKTWSEITVPVN